MLSILILVAAVGEMMLPSLLAQMINGGVTNSSKHTILILAVIMAVITVLSCTINFLSVRIASHSQKRLDIKVSSYVRSINCSNVFCAGISK